MLNASLQQLEDLVSGLVQRNQELHAEQQRLQQACASLEGELARVKDENDTLQLSLLEQEEQHGDTVARIQALVGRVSNVHHAGSVNQ